MQAVSYHQAIQNFTNFMDKVSDNHEPLIITHDTHKAVVLISLEDFNAWQETHYLTRSASNAKDLLEAVTEIATRKNIHPHALIEE